MQSFNTLGDVPPQETRRRDIIRVAVQIDDCPLFDSALPYQTWKERRAAIVAAVAQQHGVAVKEIMGNSRRRPIVLARWDAIKAVKFATGDGPSAIGRFFNRDHTTILHALQQVGAL